MYVRSILLYLLSTEGKVKINDQRVKKNIKKYILFEVNRATSCTVINYY